jgi:hypothetical protein
VTLYANYVLIVKKAIPVKPGPDWRICWSCIGNGIKCGLSMVGGAVAGGIAGAAVGTVTLPLIGTVSGAAVGFYGGAAAGLATCY